MTGFSTFTGKPLINIHDLTVTAVCRGRGIGRLLLKAVEAKARELGCGKVTLEVREDNAPARQFYQRFGFRDGEGGPATFFLVKTLGGAEEDRKLRATTCVNRASGRTTAAKKLGRYEIDTLVQKA